MIQCHPLLNLALEPLACDAYVGPMVPKTGSGRVLHQKKVDEPAYPASLMKPMYLLIHPQAVDGAKIGLSAPETISVEAEYKGKRVIVASWIANSNRPPTGAL